MDCIGSSSKEDIIGGYSSRLEEPRVNHGESSDEGQYTFRFCKRRGEGVFKRVEARMCGVLSTG